MVKIILGIDEVGRGAWAGPLVVGACVLGDANISGLTDSKKLTKKQREKLSDEIMHSSAVVGLGWVENTMIDQIGLSESLRLATRKAVKQVQAECRNKNIRIDEIIIDGTVNFLSGTPLEKYSTTLKKADLLIDSVSAAAICAKVARDNFMSEIGEKEEFLPYGFSNNAGYGTARHRKALAAVGSSKLHRYSFKPIADLSTKKKFNRLTTTKDIGDLAEDKVADYLQSENHQIIARNWRNRWCEIDIISCKDKTIYFTEVKYRKNSDFGGGIGALSRKKIQQIKFAAELFMANSQEFTDFDIKLLGVVVEGDNFQIENIFEL